MPKPLGEPLDFTLHQQPDGTWCGEPMAPVRCSLTGNPCGTDTIMRGWTCPDSRNGYQCPHLRHAQGNEK